MSSPALPPWGLTRMQPYPTLITVTATPVALDLETQTTVYEDMAGRRLEMGAHGTGTGRETKTRTSRGDGSGPDNMDEGYDQESDQDAPKG